uniref:HMG box domain-containing protein n=1 Tax=Plectus sambesii TaxID=2011161 RepID=A0A914X9Q2_9BILA
MLSRRICQEAASSSGWLRCCRAKLFPSQASTSTPVLFKKEFHSKDEVHEFSSTTQVSKDKRNGTNKGTSGFFDFSLKPPVKPVKPAMRFMKYYVGSKREHISGGKEVLQEEAVEAAHAWNALTDKEKKKYIDAYDAENNEYKKKLEAWKQDTGVEHPNALRDKKRRLALSYEKPQPPVPAYSAFRRDFAAMHPDKKEREAAQIAWRNLSDGKRQEYIGKWKTELDVYRAEMIAWREKMAREGHEDVIQAFKDGRFRRVPAEKTKHQ